MEEKMFNPKAIYFEHDIENYQLGKELMENIRMFLNWNRKS